MAVREAAPGIEVSVTTGAWIEPDPDARAGAIARWTLRPDVASVNLPEAGAVQVAEAIAAQGMGIELGVWTETDAELAVSSGLIARCRRVLIEPQEEAVPDALQTLEAILRRLEGNRAPLLVHGIDRTAWPLLEEAVRRGLATRVGLEDTLVMPDGTPAAGNLDLVRAARDRLPAR